MLDAGIATADVATKVDLERTVGYLVADVRGVVVGRVETPLYGSPATSADALAVRPSAFRRRRLIPAGAIAAIDQRTRVVGLRIERSAIKAFL